MLKKFTRILSLAVAVLSSVMCFADTASVTKELVRALGSRERVSDEVIRQLVRSEPDLADERIVMLARWWPYRFQPVLQEAIEQEMLVPPRLIAALPSHLVGTGLVTDALVRTLGSREGADLATIRELVHRGPDLADNRVAMLGVARPRYLLPLAQEAIMAGVEVPQEILNIALLQMVMEPDYREAQSRSFIRALLLYGAQLTRENAAQLEPERLKFIEHEAQQLAEEVRDAVQESTLLPTDLARLLSRMLVAPAPDLHRAVRMSLEESTDLPTEATRQVGELLFGEEQ